MMRYMRVMHYFIFQETKVFIFNQCSLYSKIHRAYYIGAKKEGTNKITKSKHKHDPIKLAKVNKMTNTTPYPS